MAIMLGQWKVTLLDEAWDFSPDDMTVGQWKQIESEYRGTYEEFITAVGNREAEAVQVFVWWLRGCKQDRLTIDIPFRRLDTVAVVDPKESSDDSTPADLGSSDLSPSDSTSTESDSTP